MQSIVLGAGRGEQRATKGELSSLSSLKRECCIEMETDRRSGREQSRAVLTIGWPDSISHNYNACNKLNYLVS